MRTTIKIITQKVLNEATGELESKDYQELREFTGLRGGFRMVYKSYDEALIEVVKSSKDLEIVIGIRDLFTYQRVENVLSKTTIAKSIGVSEQKVTTVIKKMVEADLLMRVARGVYRINPFMYLPYKAEGSILQREWKELKEE